jgi:hypothetical protein
VFCLHKALHAIDRAANVIVLYFLALHAIDRAANVIVLYFLVQSCLLGCTAV